MLRQRILTALVLVPLFIGGFLWLPTAQIALVLAALVILAAWEWTGLMGLDSMPMRAAYIALVGLLLPFSARVFEMAPQLVLAVVLIAWLLAMGWVARFDGRRSLLSSGAITLLGLVGLFVLIPTWLSLVELHGQGPFGRELLIYLMLLVWGADSGAYFAGRQWGRHKLAPLVSPGKSWEGAYGALASSLVLAILAGVYFGLEPARIAIFVVLSIVTVLFSIVGDLFESTIKRLRGVKDSGRLLPGHGGILDRIDSLTAAAPIFCLGLFIEGFIL